MKRSIFTLVLLFATAFSAFAQIEEEIQQSKVEKISKGRAYLLEKFLDRDYDKVMEAKDYLLTLEDDNYAVFAPAEYWHVLLWTKEFDELTSSMRAFDSTQFVAYKNKVKPQRDQLSEQVSRRSIEDEHLLRFNLQEAQLPAEDFDFLSLFLDWDLKPYSPENQKQWNEKSDKFLEEFYINSDLRPQNILFVNDNFTALSLSDKINRILLGLHDDVKENILSHLFILNTKDQNATEVFKLINESVKQNNIDLVVIDGLKNTDSRTIDLNVDVLAVEYKIPFIITKLVENDANYVNWMYRQKEFDKYATDILFIENCKNYLKLHHLRTCSDSLFSKLNVSFDGEKMYPVEVG